MTTTAVSTPARPAALDARTMCEALMVTAARRPDQTALRTPDDRPSLTFAETMERVAALAAGLHGLGVRRGDTVGLMMVNRPGFHMFDAAAMMLGAASFSVYNTSPPEQIGYVMGDADNRVVITERQFVDVVCAAGEHGAAVDTVVSLDGGADLGIGDLVARAEPDFDLEAAWRAVEPDDLLTLIYTSGTTGPPKGVQLVHRNLLAAVSSIEGIVRFPDGAKVISWLPAAHIAERAAHHYIPIVYAMTITTCPNPREIAAFLPAVHPTWFFAVPRIWEKLMSGLQAFLTSGENAQRNRAWLGAGIRKVELEQAGEEVSDDVAATVAEAEAGLFAGLRGMLGLDELV